MDQIKLVEPGDTGELAIIEGGGYITLVTCTPYGMNSHRLLVRGERREYEEEELMEQTVEREAKKSRTAGLLAAGCAVSAAALAGMLLFSRKKKGKIY